MPRTIPHRPAFAIALVATLVTATGCSSSTGDPGSTGDDAGTASSAVATSCNALCDEQAKGAGCNAKSGSDCKVLCRFIDDATDECKKVATTYFDCSRARAWTCSTEGGLATSNDGKCAAEIDAYAKTCQ